MPATPSDEWAVTTPEDVGLEAARLSELDKFLEQWPKHKIHAVVVARRGRLVLERYFSGEDERWVDDSVHNGGQRLFVVPDLDLVVATNAAHYGSPLQSLIPIAVLNRFVLPAVKDYPVASE